ncbi:hypothetical protein KR044_006735, partial [Drosophila immigrans]
RPRPRLPQRHRQDCTAHRRSRGRTVQAHRGGPLRRAPPRQRREAHPCTQARPEDPRPGGTCRPYAPAGGEPASRRL